jgi:hypothetical protein
VARFGPTMRGKLLAKRRYPVNRFPIVNASSDYRRPVRRDGQGCDQGNRAGDVRAQAIQLDLKRLQADLRRPDKALITAVEIAAPANDNAIVRCAVGETLVASLAAQRAEVRDTGGVGVDEGNCHGCIRGNILTHDLRAITGHGVSLPHRIRAEEQLRLAESDPAHGTAAAIAFPESHDGLGVGGNGAGLSPTPTVSV